MFSSKASFEAQTLGVSAVSASWTASWLIHSNGAVSVAGQILAKVPHFELNKAVAEPGFVMQRGQGQGQGQGHALILGLGPGLGEGASNMKEKEKKAAAEANDGHAIARSLCDERVLSISCGFGHTLIVTQGMTKAYDQKSVDRS